MPNSERLQPDYNQQPDDDGKKSQSLSNDIDSLQNGIRVDFDQKLGELAVLLARFKALVISPAELTNKDAANDDVTGIKVSDEIQTDSADATEIPADTNEELTDVADFTALYRFRLELDQEMEFREEPLHVHFRQQSELAIILQQINEKSSEENPNS